MSRIIQNIKGMPDLLPADSPLWQQFEAQIAQLLASYGYQEIRMPIVEYTDLFKRSIGEVTDIVEKEMYTFADRHGDSITLRPEGTAGCVRACLQNGLLDNQAQQRLWYKGPMFRYENPQKGRLRQFHQVGVETFGIASIDIDAELIVLAWRLWQKLGIDHLVNLEINTIGSLAARQAYKEALVAYLSQYKDALDADSQRRLTTNPLRILDSKNPETQALLNQAPALHDYLDDEAKEEFEALKLLLTAVGIPFTVNQRLVRGLDYYNKTVFEWVTDALGAQGTVCAGGRYDGLVEQLGGNKPVPAVGFAIGLERLFLLLESLNKGQTTYSQADVYFVISGDYSLYAKALQIAEQLRTALPTMRLITHSGGGSFKSQMKKADRSGASYALIMGSNELEQGLVALKPLRAEFGAEQKNLPVNELADYLTALLANK